MVKIRRSAEIRIPRTTKASDMLEFLETIPEDADLSFTAHIVPDMRDPRENGVLDISIRATWTTISRSETP